MEQETIIYYYPMRDKADRPSAAKRHWWQEARLSTWNVEQAGFCILACPVPAFYYGKKEWQPQTLYDAMENVVYSAEGMTDTFVAPALDKWIPEEMRKRWRPRLETIKQMTARQLAKQTEDGKKTPEGAVVRLGGIQDADWQMEMTWELLQPYLPRINRCVVWHEPIPGVDVREELGAFLDEYYYEYGLVVQTEKYGERQNGAPVGNVPKTADICLDFRKDNLYRASLKYLDTMVKNRYDRLVR